MKKLHKDAQWLQENYWRLGRSVRSMAKECGVSRTTILVYMKEHESPEIINARINKWEANHGAVFEGVIKTLFPEEYNDITR